MNGTIESAFVGKSVTGAELKTSAAGKSWAAFVAVVGQGDDAQFVRVTVFGETAERLARVINKGVRFYVEGSLTLRTWEKDGQTRAGLSVAAWKCELLGAIGRNKPRRKDTPALPATDEQAMQRTQRPLDETLIPF